MAGPPGTHRRRGAGDGSRERSGLGGAHQPDRAPARPGRPAVGGLQAPTSPPDVTVRPEGCHVRPHAELPRPPPARTWRERLAGLAESFDVSPRRLLVGAVALGLHQHRRWRRRPLRPRCASRLPSLAGRDGGADPLPDAEAADDGGASATTAPTEVVVHVAGAVAPPGCGACRRAAAGPMRSTPPAGPCRAPTCPASTWQRCWWTGSRSTCRSLARGPSGRCRVPGGGRPAACPGPRRRRRPEHRHRRAAGHAARRRASDGGGDHRATGRSSTAPSPRSTSCSTCGIGEAKLEQLRDLVSV